MNLRRRLEELEKRLVGGEIRLFMPDGSVRTIRESRLTEMIGEALGNFPMRDDTRAVLEAVSDDCASSGKGYLTEFIRVMAAARVTAAESEQQGGIHAVN